MKKQICEGTGKLPIESEKSILYPICPICGKEFSGQGKKYIIHNYWIEGCPKHYKDSK
jgi:ribosome-binding protein aMBF1 (putative translation factor)